jgi:hypothetical protein
VGGLTANWAQPQSPSAATQASQCRRFIGDIAAAIARSGARVAWTGRAAAPIVNQEQNRKLGKLSPNGALVGKPSEKGAGILHSDWNKSRRALET